MTSTAEHPPHIGRIVVAIDASPHSVAALTSAASLARDLGADLVGLFVEDVDVIRTADLPFSREVRTYTVTTSGLTSLSVRRQYRAQANRAQRMLQEVADAAGVRHQFRVARGRVAEELLAAADQADLITLGKAGAGRSSRRKLGTTARTVLERAPGPVLVAHRYVRQGRAVAALFDGSDADEEALLMATRLAQQRRQLPFKVLLVSPDPEAANRLQQHVARCCGDALPRLHFRPLTRMESSRLGEMVEQEQPGILVASLRSPLLRGDRLARFLYEVDSPVLLTGGGFLLQ